MMSAVSLGLDVANQFTNDATSRASTVIDRDMDEETLDLCDEVLSTTMFEEIVGSSEAICRVTAQAMRVAPSDATVLITGESGTGKELIARAIHKRSRRSRSVFTRMNCAIGIQPTPTCARERVSPPRSAPSCRGDNALA
jgi:transcriptional regulator with PAS, ATPase and Fis domain